MPDFTKAIRVVPSAALNIPEPGAVYKSESTTNGLTVTISAGFLASDVRAGDSIQITAVAGDDPVEIHQIISVDSDTELTLATGVTAAAPYDFRVYRGNGGTSRVGNNGYSLLAQLDNGDSINFIPVGQEESISLINNTSFSVTEVLSQIKVQRVISFDGANLLALDTD